MLPAGPASSAARAVWDVSEQGQALLAVLFPHLAGLRVHRVEDTGDAVMIVASCRAEAACCPRCGRESARVHGGYARVVADGAAGGRPVLIVLQVRRFRCRNPGCPAVTFAEQARGLSERYRRRSVPLLAMLAGFGLELAGRAAARLAGTLGIAVHPSTVLRLVAAAPEPEVTAAPQVLGIDDFALAKGQVYGTVLVDMRTGDVIDLLPDREAATVEAWLTAHPGAGIICRDRAGNYAEGARDGAPDAIQVADRWHLWHNLAEYAEKTVAAHRGCLKDQPGGDAHGNDAPGAAGTPGQEPPGQAGGAQVPPDGSLDACGRERRLVRRTRDRYAEIRGRLNAGESLSAISRATGLDRQTVQRFARAGSAEELLGKATSRESKLDHFKPYLHQRWNDGVTDAAALHAELRDRGWAGSEQTVRRYVRPFRQAHAAPGPAPPVPKTRQITRWLLTRPDHLHADEQAQLQAIRARCPHIDALARHVTAFAEMMTARTGSRGLESWLAAVEADDQAGLRSLAAGIRTDQQAVTNGLTLHWNSGRVEGTVNKIKMIKRQMYGRAGFDLLRKRVILHPASPGSQNSRQNPLKPHNRPFSGIRNGHPGPASAVAGAVPSDCPPSWFS
jgi:transposase